VKKEHIWDRNRALLKKNLVGTQQPREYRRAEAAPVLCKHTKAHLPAASSLCAMRIKCFSRQGGGVPGR